MRTEIQISLSSIDTRKMEFIVQQSQNKPIHLYAINS